MADPDLDHPRETLAAAWIGADVERHREGIRPAPIGPCRLIVEHIEFGDRLPAQHGDERRLASPELMLLDQLGIGEENGPFMDRGALGPKEKFRRAKNVGIRAIVEGVSEDEVDE